MKSIRFTCETEYYDYILGKYSAFCQGALNEDPDDFVAKEVVSLMNEVKLAHREALISAATMDLISKNLIVLMLSLFEDNDQRDHFKSYSDLDSYEKTIITENLMPMTI